MINANNEHQQTLKILKTKNILPLIFKLTLKLKQ